LPPKALDKLEILAQEGIGRLLLFDLIDKIPGFGAQVAPKALDKLEIFAKDYSGTSFLLGLIDKIPGFGAQIVQAG
jgi:hypothetical protein